MTTWDGHMTCAVRLLHAKVAQALQDSMLRRCVQRWKAWVDHKVDWRMFEVQTVQRMQRSR